MNRHFILEDIENVLQSPRGKTHTGRQKQSKAISFWQFRSDNFIGGQYILTVQSLLLCIAFFLPGCGGSTRGTGGLIIDGRTLDITGTPIPAIHVIVLETGDDATSDNNGQFTIETEAVEGLTLQFESQNFQATAALPEVTTTTRKVLAEFELNPSTQSARPKNVQTEESEDISDKKDDSKKSEADNTGDDSSSSKASDDDASGDKESDDSSSSGKGSDDQTTRPETSDDNSGSGNSNGTDDDSNSDDKKSDDDSKSEPSDSSSNSGSSSDDGNDDSNDSHDDEDSKETNPPSESTCTKRDTNGAIQGVTANSMTINGITYTVTNKTKIEDHEGESIPFASLASGELVDVEGDCDDGVLVAKEITREEYLT